MTSLSLRVSVQGDWVAITAAEMQTGARAVQTGIRGATLALKENWRGQIRGASLGGRLANTIRGEVYPKGRNSANASGLVYTKAPKIIDAHDKGAVITSRHGFWLAIPLQAAGRTTGNSKLTPTQWEKRTGRQLKFVYRKGRSALLVDVGKVAPSAGRNSMISRMNKQGFHRTFTPRGFSNKSIPMFVLTPMAKLKDKLDLMPAAEVIGATVPGRIIAAWRD